MLTSLAALFGFRNTPRHVTYSTNATCLNVLENVLRGSRRALWCMTTWSKACKGG
jgi:hypothetical protein